MEEYIGKLVRTLADDVGVIRGQLGPGWLFVGLESSINRSNKRILEMNKTDIKTERAPQVIGPYSQGIQAAGLVFTSGQIPADPQTGAIAQGVEAQAAQALENVKAVLETAGASLAGAVKVTVFIKDMNDFAKINEVYARYFPAPYPARSCVEVSRLPKDVLIEIEAVAAVKG